MEIKISMHSILNRMAGLVLIPMFALATYFICKDAASDGLRIFGLVMLGALLVFSVWGYFFKFCMLDYAVFKEDGIELRSPFRKKAFFKYDEVIGCFAYYTSVLEKKKYLTFTSIKHNAVVMHVDTSKFGNIIALNKMQVVYVPASQGIVEFLQTKTDLKWYSPK